MVYSFTGSFFLMYIIVISTRKKHFHFVYNFILITLCALYDKLYYFMKLLRLICLLLAVCLFSACGVSDIGKQKEVESLLASARNSVVPDRRVSVFDVEPVIKGKQVLL